MVAQRSDDVNKKMEKAKKSKKALYEEGVMVYTRLTISC